MDWMKRFSEPSTYAGLGAIVYGLGDIFKVDEAATVAQAVGSVSAAPTATNFLIALLGAGAMILREKGER